MATYVGPTKGEVLDAQQPGETFSQTLARIDAERRAAAAQPIPASRICGCTWTTGPIDRQSNPTCPVHQGT